jgi:hypothetical protein
VSVSMSRMGRKILDLKAANLRPCCLDPAKVQRLAPLSGDGLLSHRLTTAIRISEAAKAVLRKTRTFPTEGSEDQDPFLRMR